MPSIPAHTGGTQLSGISSSSTTARSSSLAAHSLPNHEDDESEWEYEYSATETETFYVTLDLSTQDFTDKRTKTIHHGRGGYQGEKQAELFETSRQSPGVAGDSAGRPGSTAVASDHDEGQPQGASPPRHGEVVMRGLESRGWSRRDSVGGGSGGGMGGRGGEEEEEDEADLDEVQIMELHSANPVISYRGRVYAAQWHQNIGTEFLLTRHDDDNHLPVLRHLDNGVDLLAASSARISVAQKELKRKDNPDNNSHDNHSSHLHQQRRQRGKRRARSTRPSGVITESQDGEEVEDENDDEIDVLVPAPDSGASQARVDQGNFLRDFIALKRSRGETDEVPVLTSADHLPKRAPSKRKTTATTTTPGRGRGQGAGGGRPCGSRRGRGGRGGSAAGHSARSLLNIAEQWGIGSTAPGGGGSGGDDDVEMANLDPALSAATPTRFADAAGTQSSSVDAAGGSMDGDTGASR